MGSLYPVSYTHLDVYKRQAFVASSGGSRSGFQIFEDGSVIYASFSSLRPEVDLIHYKFQKGKLETINQIQIKNGDGQKPEQALGLSLIHI